MRAHPCSSKQLSHLRFYAHGLSSYCVRSVGLAPSRRRVRIQGNQMLSDLPRNLKDDFTVQLKHNLKPAGAHYTNHHVEVTPEFKTVTKQLGRLERSPCPPSTPRCELQLIASHAMRSEHQL